MNEHLIEYFEDSEGNKIHTGLLVNDDIFFDAADLLDAAFHTRYLRVNHETRILGDKATTRAGELIKYRKITTLEEMISALLKIQEIIVLSRPEE